MSTLSSNVVIMGDFNINLMKLNDNISLKYKDIPSKYDLTNVIEKPTRNGNVRLDQIITNTIEKVSNHCVLPCPSIADHDASFITINTKITRYEPRYKFCSKCTREHPCGSVISVKLLCNFIEIALWHGCSPVNLLHIFRTLFSRNTSGWLLLKNTIFSPQHLSRSTWTIRYIKQFFLINDWGK